MTHKTIIQGHLEFGSSKSYEQVVELYRRRVENFYKNDVLIKEEEIFFPEQNKIIIPRKVVEAAGDKSRQKTTSLLTYIAEYAVAGEVGVWWTQSGRTLDYQHIEPKGDKVAVTMYQKGRKLVNEDGKLEAGIEALGKAIAKHKNHSEAHTLRGQAHEKLKMIDEAIEDYTHSINIYPKAAFAYYGRAKMRKLKDNIEGALADLDNAIKCSLAVMPLYWQARFLKGQFLIELEDYKNAEFEYKLFTKKIFEPGNPNRHMVAAGHYAYANVLFNLDRNKEALEQINKSIETPGEQEQITKADQFLLRGEILQAMGDEKSCYEDFKVAKELGSKEAGKILKEMDV